MIGFRRNDGGSKPKPRKRAQPVWQRAGVRAGVVAAVAFALGAGGWWSVRNGHVDRLAGIVIEHAVSLSAEAGLRVEEVLVVGRDETDKDELLRALGTGRGAPILAFDVEEARLRVESLPWIRTASVERLLPDTILLTVEERKPLALWQQDGKFALIDYEGTVITRTDFERFGNLMVVVGEDAPQHAAALLEMLGSQPELMKHVRAAVRVGGRRWNLRLVEGIDVRLPEQGAATAWFRLAEYDREHKVLARDVDVVDLRVPDRLIVRKTGEEGGIKTTAGQET